MTMKPPTVKPVPAAGRSLVAGLLLLPAVILTQKTESKLAIQVRETPGCGCCKDQFAHLRDNGSDMAAHNVEETVEARRRAGTLERYASYYTGAVRDYALESHVPAREIKRPLQEHPKAIGLMVPSVPLSAPGMDGSAHGDRHMPYSVLLTGLDGQTTTFRAYG